MELIWSSIRNITAFPYLSLFLGQHVARIDFEYTPSVPDQAMIVQWASNHVHRLKLRFSEPPGIFGSAFVDSSIPSIPWDNLQTLELQITTLRITPVSIPTLMSAPQLVKLEMAIAVRSTDSILRPTAPSPYSHNVISSLRYLRIATRDVNTVIMALEYLPERNQLQSFVFTLSDLIGSPSAAHRLFDTINSRCNPHTLSELFIDDHLSVRLEDRDCYVDISALFPMSGLKHVEIRIHSTITELTPTQAEKIPAAWPHIEKLVLNDNLRGHVWTARPRIDHRISSTRVPPKEKMGTSSGNAV
ncbi:hypothetical protein H1R20_g12708, partial [Candolleomyces eurysporus]